MSPVVESVANHRYSHLPVEYHGSVHSATQDVSTEGMGHLHTFKGHGIETVEYPAETVILQHEQERAVAMGKAAVEGPEKFHHAA